MKRLVIYVIVAGAFATCTPKLSPDNNWGNQRWVLVEMKEVPVQQSGTRRDAFVEFSPSDKRFTGNGGCNRISGNYSIGKKNALHLGEVLSTKMSCDDINFETTFLSALSKVNRYSIEERNMLLKDGNKVLLIFQSKQ